MSDTYLSAEELHDLTGKKYGKAQAKWLAARAWVFEPSDKGPRVLRAYRDQRMGLGPERQPRPARARGVDTSDLSFRKRRARRAEEEREASLETGAA